VISGPTEDAVKKSIMPRNPGKKGTRSRSRPMKKVKNMIRGKRRPKTTTGPLK